MQISIRQIKPDSEIQGLNLTLILKRLPDAGRIKQRNKMAEQES